MREQQQAHKIVDYWFDSFYWGNANRFKGMAFRKSYSVKKENKSRTWGKWASSYVLNVPFHIEYVVKIDSGETFKLIFMDDALNKVYTYTYTGNNIALP